jgi:hypothetical protein
VGNSPIGFVDLMGLAKSMTADEFRIDFVKAYDEFLIYEEKYNKANKELLDLIANPFYY